MKKNPAPPPRLVALDFFDNFYKEHFYMKAYLGVIQYAREHPSWQLIFNDSNLSLSHKFICFEDLQAQGVSGIIFSLREEAAYERILATGLPAVNIRGFAWNKKVPTVNVDGDAVGTMAAEHFLERGYRHFGFCGPADWPWVKPRCEGFVRTLKKAGYPCSLFMPNRGVEADILAPPGMEWTTPEILHQWVAALPKPAAIFACHDRRALYVLETCLDYGVSVPEEVAILGADNDEMICNSRQPNLSSVDPYCERIGYEAAELLDKLMRGEKPSSKTIRVPPRGIVTRKSTSVLAVSDPLVAKAQVFIHDHLAESIGVPDLEKLCGYSRATLEHRFRDHLGHTMVDEIRRQRLEKAKTLLLETALSMDEVALETGFRRATYFIGVFTEYVGESPHAWRMAQRDNTHEQYPDPVRLLQHLRVHRKKGS